jgi:hypothetical protein
MEFYDGRRRPKGRENALKIFVMSSISDDYEDFGTVEHTTIDWAKQDGWKFTRQEILLELADLIRKGHAQAYLPSSRPPHVVIAEYSEECADQLSFYLTPMGIESLRDLDIDETI